MADKDELKQIEAQLKRILDLYKDLGRKAPEPFRIKNAKQFIKEYGSAQAVIENFSTTIKGLKTDIVDLDSELSGVNAQIKSIITGLGKGVDDPFKNIVKNARTFKKIGFDLQDIQDDLADASEKEVKQLKKKAALEFVRLNRNTKALLQQKRTTFSIAAIESDLVKLTAEELEIRYNLTKEEVEAVALTQAQQGYQKGINKALDENLRRVKNINRAQGLTGKLITGIGGSLEKIGFGDLGLSQVQEDMKQMSVELTNNGDKVASFGDRFKIMRKGLAEVGKNLLVNLKDPLVVVGLIAKGFKALLELGQKINKEAALIGQSFANFGAQSSQVAQNLREMAAGDLSLSIEEANKALADLNKEFGLAVEFSEQEIVTFKEMSHDLGIGAENTAKLYRLSQLSGSSFENIAAEIGGTVDQLNQANDLSLNQSEILADVAKLSSTVRSNLGNNPKALATAVYQARRLGMSLDEINSAAGTTLEFESSIEKQLSAQLILGKELDLTAYRRAALTGDSATQAKELNRLIAENADEIEGNVIKQQELSAALGISQEQLLAGIESRKIQQKLSAKGITDRAKGEKELQALIKRTGMTREEAFETLDKKGLDAIIEQNKAAELGERSLQQMKEIIIAKLAPIAESMVKGLSDFANSPSFEYLSNFIARIAEFVAQNPGRSMALALSAFATTIVGAFYASKATPQAVYNVGPSTAGGLGTTAAAAGAGGGGGRTTRVPRTRAPRIRARGRAGLAIAGTAALAYGAYKMFGGGDDEETSSSTMSGTSNKVIKLLERIAKGVERLSGVGGGTRSTASFTSAASPSSSPENGGSPTMAGAGSLAVGGGLLGGAALMGRQAGSAASSAASSTTTTASRTAVATGKTLTGAAAQSSAKAGNSTVTRAVMKDGTKIYGAAAQKAVNAGSATATRATMNAAAPAAQSGGGLLSKLNPTKLITKFLGKNVMKVLKFLTKMPAVSSLLEAFFLKGNIEDILGDPDLSKQEKDFEIGKSSLKSIAGVAGGLGASALINIGNLTGLPAFLLTAFAYTGGDLLGRWLGGLLADASPSLTGGFGSFVSKTFFGGSEGMEESMGSSPSPEASPSLSQSAASLPSLNDFISRPGEPVRRFNKGDIVIGGTNLLDNNNGQSVDNSEVVNLLQRLIGVVERGGDVYLDGNKVGTALGMSSYRTQ